MLPVHAAEPRGSSHVDEAAAIQALVETVRRQKRASIGSAPPSLQERQEHLRALIGAMAANRLRIRAALRADFAAHPDVFADLIEVGSVMGRAQSAIDQLPVWMARENRPVDALFGTAQAYMAYQPKGVVGNISPWNFPFELSCGPLVEMLAAGNYAVLKPSELTPHCAALLDEMIAATFDRDHVSVAVGGLALSRAFTQQPWDHLLYTGSTAIGRQVMAAAAANLVPMTLELGGKCPALVLTSGIDSQTVRSILGMKLTKNGQVCVSVDYCLVPRDHVAAFVRLIEQAYREGLAGHSRSADATGMISHHHYERVLKLLADADAAGETIVTLEPSAPDPDERRIPLSLVIDPGPDSALRTQEVFGPILPIIPYDTIHDGIAQINALDRPLCINIYGHDQEAIDTVVARTVSGGVTVNGAALNGVCLSLGFGGSGASGIGRHHGVEGFREFSNHRAVFVRGDDNCDAIFPPFDHLTHGMIAEVFGD